MGRIEQEVGSGRNKGKEKCKTCESRYKKEKSLYTTRVAVPLID